MTEMVIPISTFILMLLFAMYGLFVSAVLFAVVVANIVQRKTMHKEVMRYAALLETANMNMRLLGETGGTVNRTR